MVLNSENWGWRERTLIEGCHANRTANMLCVSPSPYRWEPRSKNVRRFYSVKVCVRCGFVMTLPQTWKILIMVDLKLQRKTNQTCDPIHKQLRLKQLGFDLRAVCICCICAWSQIVFSSGIWSHTLQYYIHKILCIAGRKSNFQSSISSSSQSLRLRICKQKWKHFLDALLFPHLLRLQKIWTRKFWQLLAGSDDPTTILFSTYLASSFSNRYPSRRPRNWYVFVIAY